MINENLASIVPCTGQGINVIITSPKRKRNEYVYDEVLQLKVYKPYHTQLHNEFDMGYIPNTFYNGEPLKVILISEIPFKKESLVQCAATGALLLTTGKNGTRKNYEYIVGIPNTSNLLHVARTVNKINTTLINQIQSFILTHNKIDPQGLFPIKKLGKGKTIQFISKCIALPVQAQPKVSDAIYIQSKVAG